MKASPASAQPVPDPGYWRIYAAVWTTYAILVFGALSLEGGGAGLRAALRMVAHVLTGAALGIVLSQAAARGPMVGARRRAVHLHHVGLAVLFAVIWALCAGMVFGTLMELLTGRTPRMLSPTKLRWQAIAGLIVYLAIAGVGFARQVVRQLRDQQVRTSRAEVAAARAELAALRARLDPHFLFNTLHTMTALVRTEPERAEEALERFAKLLRYTLRANKTASGPVHRRAGVGVRAGLPRHRGAAPGGSAGGTQ